MRKLIERVRVHIRRVRRHIRRRSSRGPRDSDEATRLSGPLLLWARREDLLLLLERRSSVYAPLAAPASRTASFAFSRYGILVHSFGLWRTCLDQPHRSCKTTEVTSDEKREKTQRKVHTYSPIHLAKALNFDRRGTSIVVGIDRHLLPTVANRSEG